MSERDNTITIADSLWRALLAVKRDILECKPMAALNRIDALMDKLETELTNDKPKDSIRQGNCEVPENVKKRSACCGPIGRLADHCDPSSRGYY